MKISAEIYNSVTAVVLAAGKGTRMKSDLPKVAMPMAGKPMLSHVLSHLVQAGIQKFVIVVGYRKEDVISIARRDLAPSSGVKVEFAEQLEQKGTGHALLCAKSCLPAEKTTLLVTNGDMPMIRPSTFQKLIACHLEEENAATVFSAVMENPFGYGRLVRDTDGRLQKIVEEKDADDTTKRIREVNSGTYVFISPEIFSIIERIGTQNAQNEYYLPDAVSIYREEGRNVGSFTAANSWECLGANSPEDLTDLERKWRAREEEPSNRFATTGSGN